ncbi:MAG: type II secretion system protein [Verrucomicrobiota bacterium]
MLIHYKDIKYRKPDQPMRSPHRNQAGFSLIELLVVITIIAILSTASVLGIRSVIGSRTVLDTATGIAETVELARSIAMSQNTYVWLGVEQDNNDVVISLVNSEDGTSDSTSANLVPVNKLKRYSNVQLADFSGITASAGPMSARSLVAATHNLSTAGSTTVFSWPPSGINTIHDFTHVMRFNPNGSVVLSGLDAYAMIEVGFQEANTAVTTNVSEGNIAAVQIDGVTGRSRIFRP